MQNKSPAAGILSIISGAWSAFYILWAFLWFYMAKFMTSGSDTYGAIPPPDEFLLFMTIIPSVVGLFFALTGVLAIIGGIFAIKKKRWGLALAGAIAGTIVFFPCGIAAVILISMSQPEFSAAEPSATGTSQT